MSDFNPYQAPSEASQSEVDGLEGLWKVEGGVLYFRDFARLPKVDIRSGRDDLALTPASREFAVRGVMGGLLPVLIRVVLLGAVFGGVFYAASRGYYASTGWIVLVFGVLFIVVGIVSERTRKRVHLRWWVDATVEVAELKRRKWLGRLSLLAASLFLVSIVSEDTVPRELGWSALVLSWVVTAVTNRWGKRMSCKPGRDGWFILSGLNPEALSELASRQSGELERWQERRTRTRKVYTAYLYRAPLRALAGKQVWNPIVLLLLMIYKLTRSRLLIRDCFPNSESEEMPVSEWDPKVRELWDRVQAREEFRGWKQLSSRRLDSPQGDLRTEWVALVSPENEHSLVIALVRLSNAKTTQEVVETSFRSWTEDGRLLLTSNSILQRPLPPHFVAQKRSGPPHVILAAHMRRMEGMAPVEAEFPAGWQARMTEEAEARHDCLEAAGVYGPIRDQEFPDDES